MKKKIAIDLGNRNIKFCVKEGKSLLCDSFKAQYSTDNVLDYSTEEVIEIDNIRYCIEKGEYNYEFNKTAKNYIPFLLTAISRAFQDIEKIELELMIGCPCEHVNGLRPVFKEQLEGKTFKFSYNNTPKVVKIEKIGVIAEGHSTLFSIPNNVKEKFENIGIIDIGGRTINIVTTKNCRQDVVKTIGFGMLDVKDLILSREKELGKDINLNDIEYLIDNNKIELKKEDKDIIINKIKNQIKLSKIHLDMNKWFVVGGGAEDIGKEMLEKTFGKGCMLENSIYTNAIGYFNFMLAKWGN